jgi:hypothetical protein
MTAAVQHGSCCRFGLGACLRHRPYCSRGAVSWRRGRHTGLEYLEQRASLASLGRVGVAAAAAMALPARRRPLCTHRPSTAVAALCWRERRARWSSILFRHPAVQDASSSRLLRLARYSRWLYSWCRLQGRIECISLLPHSWHAKRASEPPPVGSSRI